MSFIRKSQPPPEVKQGDILTAKIVNIAYPVDGKYTDDQGKIKQQAKFELSLDEGYQTNTWITYYEQPSEKSSLGTLCLTFMKAVGKEFNSVGEALEAIKDTGKVFVTCSGFRDYNGQQYPKFKLVTDKLPPIQKSIQETPPKSNQAGANVILDRLSPELRQKVEAEMQQKKPEQS